MLFGKLTKWRKIIADHGRLQQILSHLAMITEQADEAIIVIDLTGALRFVNTAWARMHGYETSTELLGKSITIFHNEQQLKTALTPAISKARRSGLFKGRIEHLRADGTTFPAQTKMTLIKDESGQAIGLIILLTDITEPKRLEQTVTETTEQAKQLKQQIDRLQSDTAKREQAEKALKKQAEELAVANQQLQNEIADHQQLEDSLKRRAAESEAANQQLQNEVNKRQDDEQSLKQQADDLAAANEQLQNKITELNQPDQDLSESPEQTDQTTDELEESEPEPVPIDTEKLKALSDLAKRLA
jgi:PAS domain S-box-containing protein